MVSQKEAIEKMAEHIKGLEEGVQEIRNEITSLKSEMESPREEVVTMSDDLRRQLASEVENRISAETSDAINALNYRLAQHGKKIDDFLARHPRPRHISEASYEEIRRCPVCGELLRPCRLCGQEARKHIAKMMGITIPEDLR